MNETMSLRDYINNINNINSSTKIETFCRLMKKVSESIEKEQRNIIKINLDEIKINATTNEIIFPDNLFSNELDKTMAGFNTGVSLVADRKSTNEHKKVALALMIIGWYVNPNGEAIRSDIEVLENFNEYMSKIPSWLHDFFINIFRKMDYTTSFSDYYQKNFIDKINNDIKDAFASYNLNEEQLKRITSLVIKETKRMVKESNEYGFKEENVRNAIPEAIKKVKTKLNYDELKQDNSVSAPATSVVQEPVPEYFDNNAGNTNNTERGNPMQRVLTDGKGIPTGTNVIEEKPYNLINSIAGDQGSSFVLIVAGVVTIVAIVSFVTFQVLNYIN